MFRGFRFLDGLGAFLFFALGGFRVHRILFGQVVRQIALFHLKQAFLAAHGDDRGTDRDHLRVMVGLSAFQVQEGYDRAGE